MAALRATLMAIVMHAAAVQAQQLPAIRPLAAPTSVASVPLLRATAVRGLPNGNVIVHDNLARRVVLLDTSMKLVRVLLDSAGDASKLHPRTTSGILSYGRDSTLFVDASQLTLLVMDSAGTIVRTMAAPNPRLVNFLVPGTAGIAGFEARGGLIFRGQQPYPGRNPDGSILRLPSHSDSAPLLRADLATRRIDTLAWVRTWASELPRLVGDGNGMRTPINPLPSVDDWAITSDGRIAVVRSVDYHVDWVVPGARAVTSGPRLAHQWRPLAADQKRGLIDSMRIAFEKLRDEAVARDSVRGPFAVDEMLQSAGVPSNMVWSPSTPRSVLAKIPFVFVDPDSLPDYAPPFYQGAIRSDHDGNLWIKSSVAALSGGPIYDVVNGQGVLTERVSLEPGAIVVGFGAGRVVYTAVRDGDGVRLSRVVRH